MFKVVDNPEFAADVKLRLPGGEEAEFRAKFRVIDTDAFDAQMAKLRTGGKEASAARDQLLGQIVCGWDGAVGADDKPVPFSQAKLSALATHPWFSGPLLNTYLAEITGTAARKN